MSNDLEIILAKARLARRDELIELLCVAAAMPAVLLDQLQPQLRRCVDRLGAAAGAEGTEHR
jgi:uncharacterized coiled-coil protein SlyX